LARGAVLVSRMGRTVAGIAQFSVHSSQFSAIYSLTQLLQFVTNICFVTGHDFSRAEDLQNECGL